MPTKDLDPEIDWAKRADGETHVLLAGQHFTRDVLKVRKAAGMWATRRGLRCLTVAASDGSQLTVRFLPRRGKV